MKGKKLQKLLKLKIDPQVLERCLYHSSYLNQIRRDEELEIQKAYMQNGKQIFQVALATLNDEKIHDYKEINAKVNSTKDEILIQFYKKYQLDDFLYIGKGEQNGRKEHYLEHCYILFYFIYKEEGFFTLRNFLAPLFKQKKHINEMNDYKSALLEYVQKLKLTSDSIKYETVKEDGPAHNTQFTVEVIAAGYKGEGTANSKKKAQQQAAQNWFEHNGLKISSKGAKKTAQQVKKKAPPMSKERINDLNRLYRSLELTTADLSLVELDLCFTHISYANEKRLPEKEKSPLFAWFGALVLPFLIGEWILEDFSRRAKGKHSRMMELIGSLVSNSHLSTCLPNSVYMSVQISTKSDLDSPALKTNILQAVLGGMAQHNLDNQASDYFANLKAFVEKFVIKDLTDSLDYRNYFQEIKQAVQADVKVKTDFSGPSHQMLHTAQVYTFLPNGSLFLKGTGRAPLKKQSVNFACKEIVLQLKDLCDLNQKHVDLPNEPSLNMALKCLIQSALSKRNSLRLRELLGGLCLERWSIASARNIVAHLYNRQLLAELAALLRRWEILYGKEIANRCLIDFSKEEMDKIKSKRLDLDIRRKQTREVGNDGLDDYFYSLTEELVFKPGQAPKKAIGLVSVQEAAIVNDYEALDDLDDLLDFDPSKE